MFFEKIVERYPQLDEYWAIARSESKLKELAEQHPQLKVRVVPLDLSDTRSMETFENLLKEQKPDIRLLINPVRVTVLPSILTSYSRWALHFSCVSV